MIQVTARFRRWAALGVVGLVAICTAAGCGGKGATQPVTGKVTFNGKPVTGGSLTFSAIAGEGVKESNPSATAEIQSDGSFTLTTRKEGDGAVVGRYRVSYSSPAPEGSDEEPGDGPTDYSKLPPPSPYDGLEPKTKEIEITKGSNEITIELVKPPKQPADSDSGS
jgi:hypothetical protein